MTNYLEGIPLGGFKDINLEGFKSTGEFRTPNDGEWFWSPQQSKAVQGSDEVYLQNDYLILERI